jgi:hypothetical protein
LTSAEATQTAETAKATSASQTTEAAKTAQSAKATKTCCHTRLPFSLPQNQSNKIKTVFMHYMPACSTPRSGKAPTGNPE